MPHTMVERDFVEVLRQSVSRHADRTALIDGDREISYAQLWDAVNGRVDELRAAGFEAGQRVALVAENSADYLIAAFAVWRAGGVLATIYPSSGASDLEYCISSSDPVLVLTDQRCAEAVRGATPADIPTALIDAPFAIDTVRQDAAPNPSGLRAPIYLICYTSGTTSRPKAIMLSAGAVLNGVETYAEVWRLGPDDRTIVSLPMAWLFGLATTSMAALVSCGSIVVLRRGRPELIVGAIERHAATFLPGVTTMFAKLADYLDNQPRKRDLSTLRLCISGGEPRKESVFDRWTAYAGVPVHDTFCASECFPLITYDPVRDRFPVRGSAGRLVPRAQLRVIDAEGNDVKPGEVGEALANGPGMFLGYWGDPEQTRASLTEDGWYRQKDLVRVDEKGYVYVVGRLSDMIIRGGSNISPAEVERVLRAHPTVRDACVVGLPDDTYGQRVVAAVVLEPTASLDVDALNSFASTELAYYKIPSSFVAVDRIPQNTTTGKVDRRQIAAEIGRAEVH
jgi:long-chain acyl-CoA synthetase